MLKILIVDDEPLARTRLQQLLADAAAQVPLTVAGVADSGPAAIEAAERLAPDVVLLDIQMPGMPGLEAARHLAARPLPPAVVFVTAYDEHALEAFEVQALDYLLKPVRLERLVAALTRAQRLRPHEPKLEEVARALASARTHLTVSERGRMILVPVEEIVYLRAELKYVTIRTAQREYLTEESLSSLESEFGERFVRIHRNALVARKSIHGFQRVRAGAGSEAGADGHWEVLLKELPERLPISRRQWSVVKAVLRDPALAER
ncbi:MAG: LytTR family DNA-binding domain-containing protein [Burkholderiaceae bacterium]|nr:LytTR family DNA-binding domain-containing protein [Burkholderiaceae bacterium]